MLAWACLIVIIAITLFPFYWMLRTALSNGTTLATAGTVAAAGRTSRWGAFRRVLGLATVEEAQAEGGSGAADQLLALPAQLGASSPPLITAGQVFFCAMAAYAFARLRWPGRDAVFFLFLTALMVPPIFTLLPNFVLIKDLGLLNTFAGHRAAVLLHDAVRGVLPAPVLPRHLRGDRGGGAASTARATCRIFFRIILPMSCGADHHAGASCTYITAWNDYFWPLLVGSERQRPRAHRRARRRSAPRRRRAAPTGPA